MSPKELEKAFQKLVIGNKYEVKYHNRSAVMVFLDQSDSTLFFSGRPVVGTQNMPKSWVNSIEEVPDNTQVYVGRKE